MDVDGQESEARLFDVSIGSLDERPVEDAKEARIVGRQRSRGRPGPWPRPRIGHLEHHEPRPLRVPARYVKTTPPSPAPTISIVTPSFRQGRFIGRALYSVLAQQYPTLEYVVQDGGSSDETREILEAFAPLLTSWASEPDDGQADAINGGFAHTSGEIMCWLNSDDLLLPGSLAYVARYFAEHPEVDVVYGYRLMIDEDDRQIGAWILPAHSDLALTLADHIPQETVFWRRRIWEAAGAKVDRSFTYALDWDLLLRFRNAGARMACLPRYLGAFRVHEGQKAATARDVGNDECALLRERVHGRPVSTEEVLHRLRPYLVRHILVHTCRCALDRLPLQRVRVQTVPPEPWLSSLKQPGIGAAQQRDALAALAASPEESFAPAARPHDS